MIKKYFTVFIVIAFQFLPGQSGLFCHDIITNDQTPINPALARQIPLKLIATIADTGREYYFKGPYNIKVAQDSSIYVLDKDQILKFNAGGSFAGNLMKKGQGPGELLSISNYFPTGNSELVIHDYLLTKIIKIDTSGGLLEEKRLSSSKYIHLFHQDSNSLYFLSESAENTNGKARVMDVDEQILEYSKDDYSLKGKKMSFPLESFLLKTQKAFIRVRIVPFLSSHFRKNQFFISHTRGYGIKLADLDSNETRFEFRRPYDSVSVTEENKAYVTVGKFHANGNMHQSPTPEYLNDIQSIHFSNGKLWVFTSTVKEDKGVLVDIFDEHGKYLDCFYLKFRSSETCHRLDQDRVTITGDILYLVEQDEPGDWIISKYRLPAI